MSWNLVYLILGIICLIGGVWRLARRGNAIAFITGGLWFLTVLFQFYLPGVYNFNLIRGVPDLGPLLHYVAVPVFLFILLFSLKERS